MKQKAKVKKPDILLQSSEDAQTALAEYAEAEAKLTKLNGTIDEKITKIREQYSEDIQKHEQTMESRFEALKYYAEKNDDLFKDQRSIDLVHGSIGFRTGKPQLKTLKGWTWPLVLSTLKAKAKAYIRIKEEPMKDKLLADRNDPKIMKLLPTVGLEVVQEESFFVETKAEELVD